MIPLVGYADRLSVRPGETLFFHVSNATGQELSKAQIVRVISADPNPAGPGVRTQPLPADVVTVGPCGPQSVRLGSFGVAASPPLRLDAFSVLATVRPTRIAGVERPVLSAMTPDRTRGFELYLSKEGCLAGALAREVAPAVLSTGRPLSEDVWTAVWMTYDGATLQVGFRALGPGYGGALPVAGSSPVVGAAASPGTEVFIAARAGAPTATFNGRIENPMVFDRALESGEIDRAFAGELPAGLVAGWDFSREISSRIAVDIGPHGCHATLINMPTRAVPGASWSGREMCWRHAPREYAAIHFHEDDLEDCRWPATHAWHVPATCAPGSYALLLRAGADEENIPFFVAAAKGKPRAKIAVLMSTFTYVIYANNARAEWLGDPDWRAAWHARAQAIGAYPHNPGDHPEYGWSTYNYHTDLTGISLASWRRPMLTVRIGYITYPHEEMRASGLRHYPADHHLLAWLEHNGYAFDVITDWELHTEGYELLAPYPVVLTGSHPEYHTRAMLDALRAYRDGGGRFCYLGGNGFYWKIAVSEDEPRLIEIRRAEGGIRAWAADVGEYYHQLDGEYGGMWRRNGRPPQDLVGVGFTAQGTFVASYYRVKVEARSNPRVAWILAGINEDTIGGFGLSAHGAAGFELDRTDKRLGTPPHATVIAASENHPPEAPWVLVPEEQLTHLQNMAGKPAKELIRADMTFFETAGGKGAVFSTGSITFCGSLPSNGFENNISRLLRNVLDRFLDPQPFAAADGPDT